MRLLPTLSATVRPNSLRMQRMSYIASTVIALCCSAEAFAQYRYSTYSQSLYQSTERTYFPTAAPCSSIQFGCGYSGANGATLGTPGFTAVHQVTYTIRGSGVLRLADYKYMVEFFEDEPKATYTLTLNTAEGVKVEYKHDPDARDWKQRLDDTVHQRSTPAAVKPASDEKDDAVEPKS